MKKYNIAVVGATGEVGSGVLENLADRKFPVNEIKAIASASSVGKEVIFGNKKLKIQELNNSIYEQTDIAFFCTNKEISAKYIPEFVSAGAICIDKSSYFRLDSQVPLIVPEINFNIIKTARLTNIIASPNCCVIPLVMVVKPLDDQVKIKRLVVSTYQSVSGAGKKGIDELSNQIQELNRSNPKLSNKNFAKQIAYNVIPHIGDFNENNDSDEELKIIQEVEKIFSRTFPIAITCVRVPVYIGHSMTVNIEFESKITASEAKAILSKQNFLNVGTDNANYLTPIEVAGRDFVHVSRIRDDKMCNNALNLWIVGDNLRKGAALNAVHIAEKLIELKIK